MRFNLSLVFFAFAWLVLCHVSADGEDVQDILSGPAVSSQIKYHTQSVEPACVWCFIPPHCFPVPSDCPRPSMLYDPVCGCNGITYENECIAKVLNCVPCVTEGPCRDAHHNHLRVHDTKHDECVLPPVCDPGGVACPMAPINHEDSFVYAPVCGCNGVTYGNKCEAMVLNCVPWVTSGSCPASLSGV